MTTRIGSAKPTNSLLSLGIAVLAVVAAGWSMPARAAINCLTYAVSPFLQNVPGGYASMVVAHGEHVCDEPDARVTVHVALQRHLTLGFWATEAVMDGTDCGDLDCDGAAAAEAKDACEDFTEHTYRTVANGLSDDPGDDISQNARLICGDPYGPEP